MVESRSSKQLIVRGYASEQLGPEHFALVTTEVPALQANQVLVRNTYTSVDPGIRLRLRPDPPAGYFPQFPLDQPLDGVFTVGEILESKAHEFEVGETVWHPFGWRELAVVDANVDYMNGIARLRKLDVQETDVKNYLGPLGSMGLTAYAGLHIVDALGEPETIWVSAAAGAVGSLVVQLALRRGHRVIASAGSDAKVNWLLKLGAEAFNWRSVPVKDGLADAAPDGIDVYFDNVGGDHLEAALAHLRPHGRIALCGSVSDYESVPAGPKNLFQATAKELAMRGFRGSLHMNLLEDMQAEFSAMLSDGTLQYSETVYEGLERAPEALADTLAGRSVGKTLVKI
jgi:hypothetical protein